MESSNSSKKNIFKQGLKEANSKILIGGMDIEELPTKGRILDQMLLEAKLEAEEAASRVIEDATKQARELEEQTRAQLEDLRQNAYKEGFDKGVEDATNKINEELKDILISSANVLLAVEQEKEECLKDEEARVLEFISCLSKKIIYRDLTFEPSSILELIKHSISLLENKFRVNILINPKTASKLNELKSTLIAENPGIENLTITADSKLDKGDFIIESGRERIDLRLESQIETLLDELKRT